MVYGAVDAAGLGEGRRKGGGCGERGGHSITSDSNELVDLVLSQLRHAYLRRSFDSASALLSAYNTLPHGQPLRSIS